MNKYMINRLKAVISLILTLVLVLYVSNNLVLTIIMPIIWYFIFKPVSKVEIFAFLIASIAIVSQNYMVLKNEAFIFRHRDFMLMPFYEPFMWGFYYLLLNRFVSIEENIPKFSLKSLIGLLITGFSFMFFSKNTYHLLISLIFVTIILALMFHNKKDLEAAIFALILGVVIEFFGVISGLWFYPKTFMLNLPLWFILMWLIVGVLGRRCLYPISKALEKRIF